MTLPEDKALLCLQLLVEGNSLRSIQRITGVHKNTLMNLLVVAGDAFTFVGIERNTKLVLCVAYRQT
jgi:hypothetical protein